MFSRHVKHAFSLLLIVVRLHFVEGQLGDAVLKPLALRGHISGLALGRTGLLN